METEGIEFSFDEKICIPVKLRKSLVREISSEPYQKLTLAYGNRPRGIKDLRMEGFTFS